MGSTKGNFVNVHVQIPSETAEEFEQLCKDYGVNKSNVLRMLIKDWAKGHIRNKLNSSPFG